MNPRYPFGVYTISNRARSASYATSPSFAISLHIILHLPNFVNPLICKKHKKPYIKSHAQIYTFNTRFYPEFGYIL